MIPMRQAEPGDSSNEQTRREARRELQERTFTDFGDQWVRYTDNSGFYGSLELFRDVFGPLLEPAGRRRPPRRRHRKRHRPDRRRC